TIAEFGGGSANKAINDQFGKDLLKAGAISLPVTLVILLLTFGALVAAGIPLLLALTSVFAAIGLLALPSKVLPMDDAVSAVVLIALAVPALGLQTTQNSTQSYPRSLAVISAYDKIQKAFPGDAVAAQVLVEAPDVRSAGVRAAIGELTRRALATGEMFRPI